MLSPVTHHWSTTLRSLPVDYDRRPRDHHALRDSCWTTRSFWQADADL